VGERNRPPYTSSAGVAVPRFSKDLSVGEGIGGLKVEAKKDKKQTDAFEGQKRHIKIMEAGAFSFHFSNFHFSTTLFAQLS